MAARAATTSLAVGGLAAALTARPSIMPRTGLDRGLLVAGSLVVGAAAGTAFEGGAAALDSVAPGSRDALQVGLPVSAAAAGTMLALRPPTSALAWKGASALVVAGTTAAASSLLDVAPLPIPGRQGSDASLTGGQGLALLGAGLAAAGLATRHHVQSSRALAKAEPGFALTTFDEALLPAPGTVRGVSGGPDSAIDAASLGTIGRKFSEGAVPAETISSLTGRPAIDPVRVYAPLAPGASPASQVDAAMADLERLGAFERRNLVVALPAGGLVEHAPIEAAEVLAGGDVATVGIQFSRKPSILSTGTIDDGTQVHEQLLARIGARLDGMPEHARPRVMVYGESLGAAAASRLLLREEPGRLRELGAAHGLMVGTPSSEAIARAREAGTVVERSRGDAFPPLVPGASPRLDVLTHGNDAVTMLSPEILWRRPAWLTGTRPAGIPESHAWFPGVTAMQTAIDLKNAIRIRGTGHDYDYDMPAAIATALDRAPADEALFARIRGYSAAALERRERA